MKLNEEFVVEQELVARWPDGRDHRFVLRVSRPQEDVDARGQPCWRCWPILDGLTDPPPNPIREVSSFRAMVFAFLFCRQVLQAETKGARLYMTGGVLGESLLPEGGLVAKELFDIC